MVADQREKTDNNLEKEICFLQTINPAFTLNASKVFLLIN